MSFTRKLKVQHFDYKVNNFSLSRPGVVLDLCVSIFRSHKCRSFSGLRTLDFFIRNSSDFSRAESVKLFFYSYVRFKLEYASVVWCSHHDSYIERIERVQRFFLKFLSLRRDNVYPSRMHACWISTASFVCITEERLTILFIST